MNIYQTVATQPTPFQRSAQEQVAFWKNIADTTPAKSSKDKRKIRFAEGRARVYEMLLDDASPRV